MKEFVQRSIKTVAAATGSDAGLGKVGTVLAAATDYIRLDCDKNVSKVDWIVSFDKAATLEFFIAETNVTGCTIGLLDATALDDTDAFAFNGLTFIAETTEGDASAAARKFYAPDQPVGAANLAALLADPTYGVPGIGAITVTAPAGGDTLTIAGGRAPIYQLRKGSGDANEYNLAETTLAGLVKDVATASVVDATATGNVTKAGSRYQQWTDGAPYAYLGITNNDAANALTYTVKAIRYWV